jgi:PAS domain S-box-containing protein
MTSEPGVKLRGVSRNSIKRFVDGGGRLRSIVLRYGLAAVSFALIVAAFLTLKRFAGISVDPTFLIIIVMIACAWYMGLGPGLLVAIAFELTINYFTHPKPTLNSVTVIFSRLLLFGSVVWFASSRRKVEQHLRQQREWLSVTLTSIGDAVIATDPKGAINFINPTAEAVTGWTSAQAEGQPLDEVFHVLNEETRATVENPFSSVMRSGSIVGLANHTVLLTKDGREVPVEDSGAPIRDADGRIIGVIIVFHDVSGRRHAEREREQLLLRERAARAEAEASDRLKDEFLATVSHELRTPLTAILGWSSILNQYGESDGEMLRKALESIERNAKAQAHIVGDILDVSRVITGKLHIESRPVDLAPVVQSAIETMRPAARAKSITLVTTLDADAGQVEGDAARVQQIVWNLVSNAIKFTPENGKVEVRLARRDAQVEVSVMDTGIGISPEFLPHVFDRFRQADSSRTRAHGGLGLGLAIVRHLVELHGGQVFAESEGEGRGATFTVRLPRASEAATTTDASTPDLNAATETERDAEGVPDLTELRVLLVDDEPDTLDVLRAALNGYGAQVYTASSSAEALEALPRWKPDVLVSDLGMPLEDGFELIGKVRALAPEQGGNVPAAALTAYVREEDRSRALDSGYQVHVPKPVDPAMLATTVAELARRSAGLNGNESDGVVSE